MGRGWALGPALVSALPALHFIRGTRGGQVWQAAAAAAASRVSDAAVPVAVVAFYQGAGWGGFLVFDLAECTKITKRCASEALWFAALIWTTCYRMFCCNSICNLLRKGTHRFTQVHTGY